MLGIGWGVEANMDIFLSFEKLIEKIGGKAINMTGITNEKKALYHATAVAASNFVTSSIKLAKSFADELGVSALDLIAPIAKTTLDNNIMSLNDNYSPLTGPIARGDFETVRMHLESIKNQSLKQSYILMARATLDLEKSKKSKEELKRWEQLFLEYGIINDNN
ncbi:MAG: hypothetical protein Kapaf2KO_20560 [Candidatus Kapaibacteriales bacterium]